jgi:hypothetical protein
MFAFPSLFYRGDSKKTKKLQQLEKKKRKIICSRYSA